MPEFVTTLYECAMLPLTDRSNYLLLLIVYCFGGLMIGSSPASASDETSKATATLAAMQAPPAELAEYMTQLQVYTHKLSLSVSAKNVPLAQFYLHESLAHLKQIQELFPEYESQPIALLIDRLAIESYEPLSELLDSKKAAAAGKGGFDHAIEVIVNACNACHLSCDSPVRIQRNESNPYMQDFNP